MKVIHFSFSRVAKSPLRSFTLVTGNQNKLKEFIQIMGDRFEVAAEHVDLPELQGPPLEIASQKALEAYRKLGKACLTEDTSLCYNCLNGMPGPYVKWFLDAVGPEGLFKLTEGFPDKSAYAQCILAYMGPELNKPLLFVGKTHGTIVSPRGPNTFGWDPIFEPEGFKQTYAEMDKTIKNSISHRLRAIKAFIDHFIEE